MLGLLEFLENWIKKTELKYTDLRAEGAKVGVFQFTPTFAPKARSPPASTRPSSLSCVLDILCICTIYMYLLDVSIRYLKYFCVLFVLFVLFVYAVSFIAMLHLHLWWFYIVTHIRGPTIRNLSSWQFPKYVGFPPCPAWIEKKKNILVKDPITVGCHRKTPHPMRSTRDMTMTELASAFNLSSSTTLKFFDRNWTYWCSGEWLLFRSVNWDVCM